MDKSATVPSVPGAGVGTPTTALSPDLTDTEEVGQDEAKNEGPRQ